MINVVFIIVGILGFVYYYSFGAFFVLKRLGVAKVWKVFIPFYAFKMVNDIIGIFSLFSIPVKKYMGLTIILSVISSLACLYGFWGNENLPIQSIEPLWQVMILIVSLCFLTLYASLISSTIRLMLKFKIEKEKRLIFLSALLLPLPFVYIYLSRKELRIL